MSAQLELVIYNLSMDENSDVLASNIDWVESFASIYPNVEVITFKRGKTNRLAHVKVHAIRGGSFGNRVVGALQLTWSAIRKLPTRRRIIVFHHMSSITAGTIGFLFKFMRVPQGLWYSHAHADKFVRISRYSVDAFFSTTLESFPYKSNKLYPVGHGINISRFHCRDFEKNREGIVAVGRIAPVKQLEKVIEAISKSNVKSSLHFIGKLVEGDEYLTHLVNLADRLRVDVSFLGAVDYYRLPSLLVNYNMIFSATAKSIDKAALEGAISGCFILTNNNSLENITGMSMIYSDFGLPPTSSLSDKLALISKIPSENQKIYRKEICELTAEACNISNTTLKIAKILEVKKWC